MRMIAFLIAHCVSLVAHALVRAASTLLSTLGVSTFDAGLLPNRGAGLLACNVGFPADARPHGTGIRASIGSYLRNDTAPHPAPVTIHKFFPLSSADSKPLPDPTRHFPPVAMLPLN